MLKKNASLIPVAALFLIISTGITVMANPVKIDNKPVYYLSLGTSLAAGVQADPDTGASIITDVSYPSHLAELISQDISKLHHINLGCPGETAQSFVYGGLCDYEEGSQFDQALQFLHAHGKFTGLITIDMGANDVLQCAEGTAIDPVCIEQTLEQLAMDLAYILTALGDSAPDVPIVAMNYYNPLAAYWFEDPAMAIKTAGLQQWINTVLENIYASFGVPVADVAEAFMSDDLITDTNGNTIPDSIELLCSLTWMCEHQNIHANDTGYGVIAEQFYTILPQLPASGPPRK